MVFSKAGASHDSPESPNVHMSGKHHQNSTKGPPRQGEKNEKCGPQDREKRMKSVAGESEILGGVQLRGEGGGGPAEGWSSGGVVQRRGFGVQGSGPTVFLVGQKQKQNKKENEELDEKEEEEKKNREENEKKTEKKKQSSLFFCAARLMKANCQTLCPTTQKGSLAHKK